MTQPSSGIDVVRAVPSSPTTMRSDSKRSFKSPSPEGYDEKPSVTLEDVAAGPAGTGTGKERSVDMHKLDEGAQLMMEFEGQLDDVTDEEYRQLVRKIDWHILPLMLLTYAIQFADKTSLGSSAILGIKTDLGLTTARYNNCSSFFYITYLACAWPNSLLLQRFHTGWVLTGATASWAILLLCTMACNSYGGFLTTRLLLGATEGLVTPGFLLLTSAFYRHEEQATRVGFWFLMNGAAIIFSAMVAYGAQYIHIGDWSPWRPFFLILGLIGCLNTVSPE